MNTPNGRRQRRPRPRHINNGEENQENVLSSNVNFQNNGLSKRKTPRKNNKKKEEKISTNLAKVKMFNTSVKRSTKTTSIHEDDHQLDSQYYPKMIEILANSYKKQNRSTSVSNGDVVLDIPNQFVFPTSDSDEDEDEEGDEDVEEDESSYCDEAERNKKKKHRRARTSWRRSNAMNEDRYDFCLVIDSNNNVDGHLKKGSKNLCCFCHLCKKSTNLSDTENDDEDSDIIIKEKNEEEDGDINDDDDDLKHQRRKKKEEEEEEEDPANFYDNGPMKRLQLQRRDARKSGALADEDDDKRNTSTSTTRNKKSVTTTTFTNKNDPIRVNHTGIGLKGQRMVSLIRSKLRHSGLMVKRVINLKGTRTLLKVRARQSRLEDEAERMRLVMRTKDGGYARFKKSDRHAFCGAGYYSESNDKILFRSSDRQSILLHIIKSKRDVGGAQLSPHTEPCGDAIVMMFPLHMVLRIIELKRSWSTAFFCCRTPPASRYDIQRGKEYQQSDAGKLLTSMTFPFENGATSIVSTVDDVDGDDDVNDQNVGECRNPCYTNCCTKKSMIDILTFGWLVRQPLDAISEYYGETIGFYFAFLEFYTKWLAMPTAAGIVLFCFQVYSQRIDHWLLPFYSLFVSLWSMLFLVRWRRRRIELAYRWGVMDHEEVEIERIEFKGITRISTVTGAQERYYSPTKRTLKQIFCTIPITIVWLTSVVALFLSLFNFRDSVMDKFQQATHNNVTTNVSTLTPSSVNIDDERRLSSTFLNFRTSKTPGTSMSLSLSDRHIYGSDIEFWLYLLIPPILCGGLIPLLNLLYLKLATKLNDWENHKTESSYQYHLIAKVLSFRMVNCFCSLYYYAFSGRHPILRLTVQLASFMVVGQLQKHFKEVLWPCFKKKIKNWFAKRAIKKAAKEREKWKMNQIDDSSLENDSNGNSKSSKTTDASKARPLSERRLKQAEEEAWSEARMPEYNTFNDYAEMMVQYGYVTFFSMAFPLAPGFALLNNVVEIRSDAFKLCNNTRRPVARKAAGIGVWFRTLQLMSVVAVLTNLAHIGFSSDQFSIYFPNVTHAEKVVIIFGFEHCILMLQFVLTEFVPDAPFWVRNSIKREKHLSKERLHKQFAAELQEKSS
jgi:hypothetical protein